jgi:hypothetical protein
MDCCILGKVMQERKRYFLNCNLKNAQKYIAVGDFIFQKKMYEQDAWEL